MKWDSHNPFPHLVRDNFLMDKEATAVAAEFPAFDSPVWLTMDNAVESKKACNNWNHFGPATYALVDRLCSPVFVRQLEELVGCPLWADYGLNAAGLHTHARGGCLNVHQDYSIHPKLGLERRLNLIIYLTGGWKYSWGGDLNLYWSPETCAKRILPAFNRAVIFDTTDAWHGVPEPITCPTGVTRNSLALYYVCAPRVGANHRGRALFAPRNDQKNDPSVLKLIEERAQV